MKPQPYKRYINFDFCNDVDKDIVIHMEEKFLSAKEWAKAGLRIIFFKSGKHISHEENVLLVEILSVIDKAFGGNK